jgi:transposase
MKPASSIASSTVAARSIEASGSASGLKRAGAFTLPASIAASGIVSAQRGFPKKRSAAAWMPKTPAPK